jgi:two-component system, LytTR family, response regulator
MSTLVKCCVLDDMPDAIKVLERYITGTHGLQFMASFTNPAAALEFIRKTPVDLLFCDIDMPGMSGMDVAKEIRESLLPTLVIFTTAHSQHAAASYRLYALDYLMKPVNRTEFLEAIQRANDVIDHQRNFGSTPMSLLIKTDKGIMQRITISEIQYIEIDKNLAVFYFDNAKLQTAMTLKEVETRLSGCGFIRSHKSFLVAERAVNKVIENEILLINGKKIPLSRSYKPIFLSYFR